MNVSVAVPSDGEPDLGAPIEVLEAGFHDAGEIVLVTGWAAKLNRLAPVN